MHWLLFIHKILFSSTCFEPQVLIFRRIQLYTCSIWYCHSVWEFLVACRYTARVSHMVMSLCMRVPGGLSVHSLSENWRSQFSLKLCTDRPPWNLIKSDSTIWLTQAVYRQATKNSHREWQYHMLHVYSCILKMSTWGSKHVEENSILWINNSQCIKYIINSWCTVRKTSSYKYSYWNTILPHFILASR